MAISDILFRISTDTTAFQASMGKVNSALAKTEAQSRKTTSGFTAMGAALSSAGLTMTADITAPLIALGIGAANASGDIDTLKKALLATTGSAAEAEKQLRSLQEIALLPGIGLEEAVRGSVRLQNYGLSAALSEKALRNFSNAVAAGGGSADDTSEALRQLGQMYGRGKITMDNLRIILERVPQAAAIIRKEWGSEALADPAKAFEKLGLTSQQVIETLVERMDDIPRVAAGFKTSMENLGQAVKLAAARIGDQLTPAIIEAIPTLEKMAGYAADAVESFMALPEPIKNTGIAIGALAVAAGPLVYAFGTLLGAIQPIKTFVLGAAKLWAPASAAVGTFATAVVANGIAVNAAIVGMAAAWVAGAAVAVYSIASIVTALAELYSATQKVSHAQNDQSHAIEMLLSRVRKQHPEIGALELRYRSGAVSAEDFSAELLRLAKTMEGSTASVDGYGESGKKAALAWLGFKDGQGKTAEEVAKTGNIIKVTSVAGLIYVESLERVKAAVSKIKDVMYEWSVQGTAVGKSMDTQKVGLDRLASASDTYAASLRRLIEEQQKLVTSDAVKDLPVALGMPTLPTTWTGSDSAREMGIETESERAKRIADLRRNADAIREANRRGDPNVSGNMVIEAEQKLKDAIEGTGRQAKASGKIQAEAMKQVSTVVTDLSRGITQVIFNGGKLGDMLKSVASQAAQSITRLLIEGALAKLSAKLLNVGGLMGKVFGGGTGAVMSAVGGGGAQAAGGIAGSSSGAVAGIAGSGIAGVVTAVSSAISAVSDVFSNFQFAAMNKSLDLIEHEVRYSQIHLSYILAKQNEYLPKLKDIWDSLIRMETSGAALAGCGGQINVNMAGAFLMSDSQMNDFADRLVRFIKPKL